MIDKNKLKFEFYNLALVIGVIGILLVLFTPVPTWLLDFLLLTNFTVALIILLLALDTEKPLSFSTFPSLLLITTLFRLALNISSTRLILDHADAGKVIAAVGNYMVAGNLVVGFVVFFILIVVQYIVITNGAQRVAEVAARFTLDSLPGKQMSIDADLNMGLIDSDEAKLRRHQLEQESNFYGAMDGASKFVKGDAIAGVVIIIINIIGGLSIGMLQKGMGWSEALQHYSLLTIGDGIVTQIPSLIISVAAGIIITRAATDTKLGQALGNQFFAYPQTIIVVGVALTLMLFLPGLPVFPILILLLILAGAVWYSIKYKKNQGNTNESANETEQDKLEQKDLNTLKPAPFELKISPNLEPFILNNESSLIQRYATLQKQLSLDLGIFLPKLSINVDKRLTENHYQILIYSAVVARGSVNFLKVLAINSGNASMNSIQGDETKEPTYGLPALWIENAQKQQARTLGFTIVEPETVIVTHLSEIIKRYLSEFLTRAETEKLIQLHRDSMGTLLDELIPSVLTYSDIQRVLQLLLKEQVSIKNMEKILEVLIDIGRINKVPEDLAEKVRERLGSIIYEKFLSPDGNLQVMTIAPEIESHMLAMVRVNNESILPPQYIDKFLRSIVQETEKQLANNVQPILLCSPSIRRPLRAMISRAIPHVEVLSIGELGQYVQVSSAGVISIPEFHAMEMSA
ncbi:flagellar biosynthesis protein FlhA [Acinetobacter calcoaceticus]|uniref:flagellar biosynthesis protein FlhA n=1 Tax=Acinetobacter calcoaceticus TaxID=471 RepID=UPI001AE136D4|nr:flagellar biosynthesis protein FlhA [Acinetobacter calcoaceticus]MBP2606022.1 flagellar biosynthesis protein FlhA [Acinetobacter calcoaceticus]